MQRRAANGAPALCVIKCSAMVRNRGRKPDKSRRAPAGPSSSVTTIRKSPLELDRLIHERLRLGILSALAVSDRLTFTDLKQRLGTTDGNLSVHARKLEKAAYIACEKSFEGRVPRTEYRITPAGRRAFEKYLASLQAIIDTART